MVPTPSAASAPGKVLLAGGYLVLDPAYSGLVFALSARIHAVSTVAASAPASTITANPADQQSRKLEVSKNTFVETTIRYVLAYLAPATTALPGVNVTVLADNDYYSQPASAATLPRFNSLGVPISEAHKTGLGSSAALVTSLTTCLVATFSDKPVVLSQPETQQKIHNLAQAAHCAAQGKVGSGFDVAAAVFGSCVYHRFSPAVLEAVGDAASAGFATRLAHAVDAAWDVKVEKTRVPPGLRLVMGDVDCGSSTPGMVKQVLAWRKADPQVAAERWGTIEALNQRLIALFDEVRGRAETHGKEYEEAVQMVAGSKALEGGNMSAVLLAQIAALVKDIRENIRAMGEAAGVPIEPPAQTSLLDGAGGVKGVLGGVVPGAGGYDAVAFLVADAEGTVQELKAFLETYEFGGEKGGGKVVALGTREEHDGVKLEDVKAYDLS